MPGPYQADVHALKPLGAEEEKKRRADIAKRGRAPLYVYRAVENADEITQWAKAQGFETVSTNLHVTVIYSKEPVDWLKMGASPTWTSRGDEDDGRLTIAPGGPRVLESFDQPGLAVLGFASDQLAWRNREFRDKGASWDFDSYTPHITITLQRGSVDIDQIKPYTGKIVLGPEVFEPIAEGDWREKVVEKSADDLRKAHVDAEHGLVFGFAVVSKVGGEPYFDRQLDPVTKEHVGDHIPEEAMLEAALDFAKNSRVAKEMHTGDQTGMVPFILPLTTDLRKFIVENDTTGLLIGMAPAGPALAKFKAGDYTGFSIGGNRITDEEVSD